MSKDTNQPTATEQWAARFAALAPTGEVGRHYYQDDYGKTAYYAERRHEACPKCGGRMAVTLYSEACLSCRYLNGPPVRRPSPQEQVDFIRSDRPLTQREIDYAGRLVETVDMGADEHGGAS